MAGTINVTAGQHARTRRPASTTPSTASRPAPRRVTGCAPPTRAARSPFASQVTVSAEGQHTVEYRSVDKAGNAETAKTVDVRHRHPGPGLPGHPGLRRPDVRHRAAAGPLLRHRVRSRRRAADLQVGVRQRRLLRPRRRAHVHPAGDVHGQGDGDRRRGRQDLAGGHGHGPRAGRRAADGRGLGRASPRSWPAGSSVAVQRARAPTRTARRTTSLQVGLRRRRQLVRPEPDAHVTCCRAPTTPRSRSPTARGATATKTLAITVTDPPGQPGPGRRGRRGLRTAGTAPLTVQFTADGGRRRTATR